MILPTKGIPPDAALLTVGAEILRKLDEAKTVSRLWEETRKANVARSSAMPFDWFVLALDLLFLLGVVELRKGRIVRLANEASPTVLS